MTKKRIIALCAAAALCLSLLSACSRNEADSPSIDPGQSWSMPAFAQEVQEKHEFYSLERVDPEDEAMGELMTQMLENYYPGLSGLDLEQMEIYIPMVSFSGGELALVEARNAEDAAGVKDIFQARIDAKSTEGPGNYPEEVEMWQRSSQVAEHGNYVMLVCHDDADAIVSEFNALFS